MTGERATIFCDLRVCRPAHKPRALRRDNIFAAYMLGALGESSAKASAYSSLIQVLRSKTKVCTFAATLNRGAWQSCLPTSTQPPCLSLPTGTSTQLRCLF